MPKSDQRLYTLHYLQWHCLFKVRHHRQAVTLAGLTPKNVDNTAVAANQFVLSGTSTPLEQSPKASNILPYWKARPWRRRRWRWARLLDGSGTETEGSGRSLMRQRRGGTWPRLLH